MARKDVQDPRKRLLFEEMLQGVSGFFRELNRELHAPSAREQELAAIHKRLDDLEGKVQKIVEQDKAVRQLLLDMEKQLKRQEEEMVARFETLQQSLTPQELAGWRAALNRLKGLGPLLVGATGGALYQALIQEEVYPQLKKRLQQLVDHLDQVLEWPTPSVVTPEPTPTSAPAPTIAPTPEAPSTPMSMPASGLEPELIFVPAGRFLMGSSERDPDASKHELPLHEVYVSNFYIAKYPVTCAEYKRFMSETGYKPVMWDGSTWWLEQVNKMLQESNDNHPIRGISWKDANAYCKWLSEVTGKSYRLPSEAEWEKAARGGWFLDGDMAAQVPNPNYFRIYPWGDEWDASRCNTSESGIGGTTPVRSYPDGASPYGVQDMVGNVFEWTRTLWAAMKSKFPFQENWEPSFEYPYDPGDGREDLKISPWFHVLRGGCFCYSKLSARCASRSYDNPNANPR